MYIESTFGTHTFIPFNKAPPHVTGLGAKFVVMYTSSATEGTTAPGYLPHAKPTECPAVWATRQISGINPAGFV